MFSNINSLVLFLFLITSPVIRFCDAGTLIYLCREFGPNFPACGYNSSPELGKWSSSSTRYLPKISANLDQLQEWVLLMNATTSSSTVANYELAIQSVSSGDYCVQFAALYSDRCFDSSKNSCGVNFQFRSTATNYVNPSKTLRYSEGQWSLLNYEFHLENGIVMRPVLIGSIDHPAKYAASHQLYIAIKYIDVVKGHCPTRIGTRVSFWIMIMVIFTLITTLTFVYIGISGMIESRRIRKAKALALQNGEDKSNAHRSPSVVSYVN